MRFSFFSCSSTLLAALAFSGEGAASNLNPRVLPLIVRNPYLSAWLQDARDLPWSRWPMFWTGEDVGFSVLASTADNSIVYPLLGRAHDSLTPIRGHDGFDIAFPTYLGSNYDASTTNLTYSIPAPGSTNYSEPVTVVLSFLSPITPSSTLRQAIPASYLTVHVEGNFNVDVYVDLNGQWVSGHRENDVVWELQTQEFEDGKGLKTLKVQRREEQLLTEHRDRSEWGSLHFSAPLDVHHEVGTSALLRRQFSKAGKLRNVVDRNFRGIMNEEPVFAFSKSFHLNGTSSSDSVLFTIAHIQDPVVQFASARGLTLMKPLWCSFFDSAADLLTFHYFDYSNAYKLALEYSTQLAKDAYRSGAEDYADILALSARQVLGATSFSGTPENPILFLKEISSNGNFQTIDVIFPSFPFFLYTNPRWLAYLLEPLIEHMLSGQYPNTYAMHDLGTHFPNATGHPDGRDEYMPVEECGNILMMGLALANSLVYDTNESAGSIWASAGSDSMDPNPDSSPFALTNLGVRNDIMYMDDSWGGQTKGLKQAQKWVKKSYRLWKQWTGYLVRFSLRPENQLSTDDFAGWLALQTNLALKGIIGIKAMSGLAAVINETADAEHYDKIARDYIGKWEEYGVSRDKTHAKLAYDWFGSWTTIYNIYGDALLCFHLEDSQSLPSTLPAVDDGQKPIHRSPKPEKGGFVPKHIYKMQSDWYHAVRQKYGLPLDSRHLYTKTDWEFFAASVTSRKVRSEILESVALWVNETVVDRPFTDLHKTEGNGGFPGPDFFARPVVGGHFAFLTLERACGGKAMDGLKFLDDESSADELEKVKVAAEEFASPIASPITWNFEARSDRLYGFGYWHQDRHGK